MKKKVALSVLAVVIVLGILGGIKASQIGAMIKAGESFVPPPISVTTARVDEQTWQESLRAVGTVVATQSVLVGAEVPGMVKRIAFSSGQEVQKGAVLLQLDASLERAQLQSALANKELADVNLARVDNLAKQKVTAQAELDAAQAQAKQAAAQLANVRALLSKKTVRAPFTGKLGIRQVDQGQILAAGTPLVSLQSVDKVYVDFYVPQRDLGLIREGQTVSITTDAALGRTYEGVVDTIEPSVDVATRNVRIRSIFDNAEGQLRPGLFVEVKVGLPKGPPIVVAPATAVVYAPYGNSIYVVKEDESGKKVEQVFVELGERRGDFIAVKKGLTSGQRIVSSGAFKLSNGVAVAVQDGKSLNPQLAPKPEDS